MQSAFQTQLRAWIIVAEDLIVGLSVQRQIAGPILAQANAMPVAYGGKHQIGILHLNGKIGRIEPRQLPYLTAGQSHLPYQHIENAASRGPMGIPNQVLGA